MLYGKLVNQSVNFLILLYFNKIYWFFFYSVNVQNLMLEHRRHEKFCSHSFRFFGFEIIIQKTSVRNGLNIPLHSKF